MDNGQPDETRIRLTGDRFKGGRLPVDSLVELERYQRLLRTAAEAEWARAHPDEELPADFDENISLTIERIEDGSADVYLAFEQHAIYAEYQESSQNLVDSTIAAAYDPTPGRSLPQLPPEIETEILEGVAALGETLTPDQSFQLYPEGPKGPAVSVTVESRAQASEKLFKADFFLTEEPAEVEVVKRTDETTLVGRFTKIDARAKSYRFESEQYGELSGKYTETARAADIRALVEAPDLAPITRITAMVNFRDGRATSIKNLLSVEEFITTDAAWGERLRELASMAAGWDGDEAEPIVFAALDHAKAVLEKIEEAGTKLPNVFPVEDGGISLEWASPEAVRSIEVTPNGAYALFYLPPGSFDGQHDLVLDLPSAVAFATKEVVE